MGRSNVSLRGFVSLRKNGKLVRQGRNLVVDQGLSIIGNGLRTGTLLLPGYMAIGTSTTLTSPAHNALQGTEVTRSAVVVSGTGRTVIYTAGFSSGLPGVATSLAECGLFTASSGGTMFARWTFTPILADNTDVVDVVWTLVVGDNN